LPRLEILPPGANVTFWRFVQEPKQDSEIVSIDAGMEIDSSEHERNADSPRVEILQPVSNATCPRSPHEAKHFAEIVVSSSAGKPTEGSL
jgi:hypothetical protein